MVNRSTRRTVSRPGVSGDGSAGAKFVSPYQPPSAAVDFDGDMVLLDPNAYTVVHVGDRFWQIRPPSCVALKAVVAAADSKGGEQIHAVNTFLREHMHPDDFVLLLRRLLDPEDAFTESDYMELYRQAVTVGTARPFRQSWASPAPPPSVGASSEQNWLSAAYPLRSRR